MGAIQQNLKSLPVFLICISIIFFKGIFLRSKLKSKYCPPAIPECPEHLDIKFTNFIFILSSNLKFFWLKISKAKVSSELPARIAVDSPNFL